MGTKVDKIWNKTCNYIKERVNLFTTSINTTINKSKYEMDKLKNLQMKTAQKSVLFPDVDVENLFINSNHLIAGNPYHQADKSEYYKYNNK